MDQGVNARVHQLDGVGVVEDVRVDLQAVRMALVDDGLEDDELGVPTAERWDARQGEEEERHRHGQGRGVVEQAGVGVDFGRAGLAGNGDQGPPPD